ncbi:hypothetical protein AB1J28_13770 [Lysinibacillus irui]|uniref:hypothetical protein n=1 Tax=Lysinibacillus irui TaxID=2998077 RepID=UPI003D28B648
MKKEFGMLVLSSILLLVGCSVHQESSQKDENSSTEQLSMQPKQEAKESIIWFSENNEVQLTPKTKVSDGFSGVTVAVNNMEKEFNWRFTTITEPQVYYTDITGDGKKEAVVIINTGRGTGLTIDEVHVQNSENLSEINVQPFEEIISDHFESKITKKGENLNIQVVVQGTEQHVNVVALDPHVEQEHLNFGGVVYYKLDNQKLTVVLGASVGVSPQYVGDVYITYQFDEAKNEFLAHQMKFVPLNS